MCKIILKYQNKLTSKEIEDHRETCEEGAGTVFLNDGYEFEGIRHLQHDKMKTSLENRFINSPFYLFHSRNATCGIIELGNVQPFNDKEIAFCHNGSIPHRDMAIACLSAGIEFSHRDSDSKMLFRLMQKNGIEKTLPVLPVIDDNFVTVSLVKRRIYIYGKFEMELNKRETHILSARNKWGNDKIYCETTLEGEMIDHHIIDKYTPPKTYYNGFQQEDHLSWWEKENDRKNNLKGLKDDNGFALVISKSGKSVWDQKTNTWIPKDEYIRTHKNQ